MSFKLIGKAEEGVYLWVARCSLARRPKSRCYALCDAAVRTHVPGIAVAQSQPQWPYPTNRLG